MRGTRTGFFSTAPVAASGAVLTLLAIVAWPLASLAQRALEGNLLTLVRTDRELREAFAWGAMQAAVACLFGVVFGLASAYCWARLRYPGRTVLRGLALAPIAIPTFVIAVGIEALFAAGTPASDLVSFVGAEPASLRTGTGSVILTHGLFATSIIGWFASVAWASVDARKADAARTLGAGRIRAARVAVWPTVWPAAVAAAGMAFIQTMLSYGAVAILTRGQETPEGLTVRLILAGDSRATAVAALTAAYALLCGLITIQFLRTPTPDPRGVRPLQRPGGVDRLVALTAALPAFLVAGAVTALALRAVGADQGLSTEHLQALVDGPDAGAVRRSATGSLLAALPAAVLAATWGGMAGAALGRMRGVGGTARAIALLLPIALSPAAITYGWSLASPTLDARVVLALVQATGAFPFVAGTVARMRPRSARGTLAVARTLGARRLRAWRVLRGPTYGIALVVGCLVGFALAVGDTSAAAVARVSGGTLPLHLLDLDRRGEAGPTAALAAVILLITVLAFTLGDPIIARLGRARR